MNKKKVKRVFTFTIRPTVNGRSESYSARNYECMTSKDLIDELFWMADHPSLEFPHKIEIIKNGKRNLATGAIEWDIKEVEI